MAEADNIKNSSFDVLTIFGTHTDCFHYPVPKFVEISLSSPKLDVKNR